MLDAGLFVLSRPFLFLRLCAGVGIYSFVLFAPHNFYGKVKCYKTGNFVMVKTDFSQKRRIVMAEETRFSEGLPPDMSHLVELDPAALNATAQAFQEFLRKPRMIGQERLQDTAIRAIGRFEGALRNRRHPIRSILVDGPSGTGKTMIFELMAEFLFGSRESLTKLSGPEYQEEHTVSKLIGSPPGYIGFGVDERGPFPMLSPWNIGKYHYFAELRKAAEKIRKKSGALEPTGEELRSLIDDLWHKEHIYGDRIASLADIIAALESESPDASEHKKGESQNAKKARLYAQKMYERRAEIVEAAKAHIELYSVYLFGFYKMIDTTLVSLGSSIGEDLSFNPEIHKRGIILIDEREKAHPRFMNIFYEILDRARITLQNGTVTDFSETIIGMTSNEGAKKIEGLMRGRRPMGFEPPHVMQDREEEKDKAVYLAARDAMNDTLPAPLRGRIDEVNVPHPFTPEQLKNIIRMTIRELQETLDEQKTGIALRVSDPVVEFLWIESTDKPEEGARLVGKKLNAYLRDPLDTLMQTGQVRSGDIVYVDMGMREDGKSRPMFRVDTRGRIEGDETGNDETDPVAEEEDE
jgi:hypothetical protein